MTRSSVPEPQEPEPLTSGEPSPAAPEAAGLDVRTELELRDVMLRCSC